VIKEYSLEGIRSRQIDLLTDERGLFAEAIRSDWSDLIDEWVTQANLSLSYPGIIRAWHRHLRGQVDYFLVVKGSLKICAYDERSRMLVEIVSSSAKPSLVRIPGHYWHGIKNISDELSITVYFTNRLYDARKPDEERRPWNDQLLIPAEINGSKSDPRVGMPFDWFYPPYK
jgi:dTDP-4-dehydrorhamnose 3,5-epimerase